MMFNGLNSPKKRDIFGPSGAGGSWADVRNGNLIQHGEGLSSFIGNLFRKITPLARTSIKKAAKSSILKDVGKQVLDSSIEGAANVASDLLSGDKKFKDSASDQLTNARKQIAVSLRKAAIKKRKSSETSEVHPAIKHRKKSKYTANKTKRPSKRKVLNSVFSDDEDE